jgi:thiol-disulfide isomerase/thioredoxin
MDVLILIRAAAAAAIILIGLGGYALVSRLILRRVRGKAGSVAGFQPGIPAILYFTTPDCIPCKTVQRPALRVLSERLGDRLKVIEVDATQNPRMAQEWGVLSVPTTFIIDPQGRPRHINHGAVSAEKLFEQLTKAGG